MEYNSQREHLIIPEYGRNIQKLIEYTVSIEDDDKRNKSARVIINMMSQINPGVKDSLDYQRKLWDHMYIISKFRLVVESPFPPPSQDELDKKPGKIPYSEGKIKYRHYGKNIENIIEKAVDFEDGDEKEALTLTIANHLKKSYLNWNRDSVADETIIKQLTKMSDGKLELPEETKLSATNEILARNKPRKKKFTQKGKDHSGRRRGYSQKSY
jgi:hypothetical protein